MLDVLFHDDLARLRTRHGPATVAINLLKQAKPVISLRNRRERAAWKPEYLAAVVQQAA